MKTRWINTNDFYHEIIAAPDQTERERLYREKFIRPLQSLLSMFNTDPEDDLAVARAWAWLLPKDLTKVPDALQKLEAASAWDVGARALAEGAARFRPYSERLPIELIEGWLILANPLRSDPIGRGYTGGIDFTQPRFIAQYDTPNDYNLPRLPGLIVHEMHHIIRLRLFPWDMQKTRVADYIILEGLAESFAAALFGEEIVGYYVSDFNEAELQTAKNLIRDGLEQTGFDLIRAYIFGDYWAEQYHLPKMGMPAYGGYAIGYRIAQDYLQRAGKTIEEATFLTADEIIRESGFFA